MEADSVALCALVAALKWPARLPVLRELLPELPATDPVHRVVWESIFNCWQTRRSSTPEDLQRQVIFDVRGNFPVYGEIVDNWVTAIGGSSTLPESYCIKEVKDYAHRRLMMQLPNSTGPELEIMLERIKLINHVSNTSTFQEANFYANNGRGMLSGGVTLSTGLWYMDEAFGGLFPTGLLVLYVIPSKSGKTLISFQLCKMMVEHQLSVLFLNFEQQAAGNMAHRVFTVQSGFPMSTWNQLSDLSEAPLEAQQALQRVYPAWSAYCKILTADQLCNGDVIMEGVDSIDKIVEDLYIGQGIPPPDLIIIDWWRRLWDTYCARQMAANPRLTEGVMRQRETEHLLKLKRLAERRHTRIIVFQQMRAAIAGTATNIDKVSVYDGAENKSLVQVADAGLVTTRKDPRDSSMSMKLELSRFCESGWSTRLLMDGDHQIFVPYDATDDSVIPDTPDQLLADLDDRT